MSAREWLYRWFRRKPKPDNESLNRARNQPIIDAQSDWPTARRCYKCGYKVFSRTGELADAAIVEHDATPEHQAKPDGPSLTVFQPYVWRGLAGQETTP